MDAQGYRERNAWLQPRGKDAFPRVALDGPEAVSFALSECALGLIRLFGEDILKGPAACTIALRLDTQLPAEGYHIAGAANGVTVYAADVRGMLYGVYALLFRLSLGDAPEAIDLSSAPRVQRRAINHWDNMTGTIERGYSGRSLFFRDGNIAYDPERVREYARLLASVGINEISLNSVNVTQRGAELLTEGLIGELSALADIFRPFGIRLLIAVHFESPTMLGGSPTADPLDARVAAWWREAARTVYAAIPDLAGFLVKADSEFRAGPSSLGRTQADGANVIARAVAPYGGVVYWRCFVYDCEQDWRDTRTDRPMAAYQHFYPLDGQFDDNVILQVKNGPSDFQVREPISPLFGAMRKTKEALELQITQEYTGQQIDLYALAVQWQEVFDSSVSDTRTMRDLVGREIVAVTAVSNVGDDENWTGHALAQANLFAYGRLAFDPSVTAEVILGEWAGLTFGTNPALLNPLVAMLLASRSVYEMYTAPLGIGWMVNVGNHYGPSVDGYEYMRWGTYHRADTRAIGVDRTASGTGFTRQYHPWLSALYEDINTCPEEELLFFHRLPYDHRLKNGNTLLQHIYDTHFEGVSAVESFIETWERLMPLLPEETYRSVRHRFERQLRNAREWRDVINTYFFRKTGVKDARDRMITP